MVHHNSAFTPRFWKLLEDSYRLQVKNVKPVSWKQFVKIQIRYQIFRLLGRRAFYLLRFRHKQLNYFLSKQSELEMIYGWLKDEHSKSLMIELVIRKSLGDRYLKPLIDEVKEFKSCNETEKLLVEKETQLISIGTTKFSLNRYNLTGIGYLIEAQLHKMNVVETFMAEQYRYKRDGINVGIEPGDIGIDAGGCWGDTALYLASAGAEQVYSFEFVNENLLIFEQNLNSNPGLHEKITLIKNALWSQDNLSLSFESKGPATNILLDNKYMNSVLTITLDTFLEQQHIERVDFIKMDIEGSELNALMGAQKTIREFAPKLAITVYHKKEDLIIIPIFLKSLRPDYDFYLEHFTTTMMETVLFAVSRSNSVLQGSKS